MNKKIISVVSIILVIAVMCTVLAACNAENVTKKLEKKGYTVLNSDQVEEVLHVSPTEDATVEWFVFAVEGDYSNVAGILAALAGKKNVVQVTKFNKTEDAKKAVEDMGEPASGMAVKRSGKIVYYGTVDGVKAAK